MATETRYPDRSGVEQPNRLEHFEAGYQTPDSAYPSFREPRRSSNFGAGFKGNMTPSATFTRTADPKLPYARA